MKITNRIPNVGNQAPAENEVPIQPNKTRVQDKFEGPDSITRSNPDQIESRVDKFEVPNPALTNYFDPPPIPDAVLDIINNSDALAAELRGFLNESQTPSIESRAEKYKGPDSVVLRQERGSRVDQYKGPDSLKPQERGSRVDEYKGPKSILESRVNKYKGPDSVKTDDYDVPKIPDAVLDIINNSNALAAEIRGALDESLNRKEESTDSQTSPIASRVEEYKGPKTVLESEQSSSSDQSKGKRTKR